MWWWSNAGWAGGGGCWSRGHAGGGGRFALTSAAPARRSRVAVRAVVSSDQGVAAVSAVRTVRVLARRKGQRPVVVSSRTEVLDASIVLSAPAPGRAGKLRYAGGNDVRVGQILAIGAGRATPDGFLGRVTKVTFRKGQTIVSTRPATLLQAVPSGSLNATFSSAAARDVRPQFSLPPGFEAKPLTCTHGAQGSITSTVSFNAGLNLMADWSLFGGLQSASLTANASASASLKAAVSAAATCTLGDTTLVKLPGPKWFGFVGFVPVIVTSDISVHLDGDASVSASASASFSTSAGIGWDHNRGFYPIHSFNSHFNFAPPSVSGTASVDANLTPTVDVSQTLADIFKELRQLQAKSQWAVLGSNQ
jgi:hypothetical protein